MKALSLIIVFLLICIHCDAQKKISLQDLSSEIDRDFSIIIEKLIESYSSKLPKKEELFILEFVDNSKEAKTAHRNLSKFITAIESEITEPNSSFLKKSDVEFLKGKNLEPMPVVAFLALLESTKKRKNIMLQAVSR